MIQIVAVGSVSAEILLIEKTLDAATQADLIGISVSANRPTHAAMPAAPQKDYGNPSHPSSDT